MPNAADPKTESIAFDEAIHRMERHPPYGSHVQDVADQALRLLDAMQREGFSEREISDALEARVLLVDNAEAREAVAGGCARAMTIRYHMGRNAQTRADVTD